MKKLLGLLLLSALTTVALAQTTPKKVAVAFDTDTQFALVGPFNTRYFPIDLTKELFSNLKFLADTTVFNLNRAVFPESFRMAHTDVWNGLPSFNDMRYWMKQLRKKENFDYLLLLYKPLSITGTYANLSGFSYGMSVSSSVAFSLFDAVVIDLSNFKPVSITKTEAESDFIAGSVPPPVQGKTLSSYGMEDLNVAVSEIRELNQNIALKAYQCLIQAWKRSGQK